MAKVKVKIPPDLAAALSQAGPARASFDAMPPSHQYEWIRVIDDAKKPETRARRIQNTVKEMAARAR